MQKAKGKMAISFAFVIVYASSVLVGCGPSKVKIDTSPQIEKYRVKTVVMLPFEALSTPQVIDLNDSDVRAPAGAVRSDIEFAIPQTVERLDQPTRGIPPFVADKVTGIVYGKLHRWEGIRVLPPEDGARAVKALGAKAKGLALSELAREVAGRLGADAVLAGKVLIYQEREGGRLGAKPAMVGFELKLVGADGRTLWVGNYYEKQRPMNEDFVGFVQRGGVFVTAEELAQYGADHVIQNFPFGGPPEK